jgi:hypothetical protein
MSALFPVPAFPRSDLMARLLRGCLALGMLALVVCAPGRGQNPLPSSPGTKPAPPKVEAGKPASVEKEKPPRPEFDKLKLPPDAIVIVVEKIEDALARSSGLWLISPEAYQKLEDRIRALEKQLKVEKKPPHACKLSGRVEGDFAYLQAAFVFTTEQPKTSVVLGLQGAHLTDEGSHDGQVPVLEASEDGFAVRVEKPGTHHLTLNLKLPLGLRRTGTGAPPSGERGFELGLPGAAVTTLSLDLPKTVKEVRWNDFVEKNRDQGKWELALGKIKTLTLSWRESVSAPGSGPLLQAAAQIAVKVDEGEILTSAELILEDLRGQTKEWQLLLPPNARVEVKAPGGLGHELVPPENAKNPVHILRLKEASAERISVLVQGSQARPLANPRFAVGPFGVLKAFQQKGTIVVRASPEALRGHRLVFHRSNEVIQQETPAVSGAMDVVATFHYGSLSGVKPGPKAGPVAKAPLEIELKPEKGQLEAQVDHVLRLREAGEGWQVEVTTRIKGKALFVGTDVLEVQLPLPRLEGLTPPTVSGFPGSFPWVALASPGRGFAAAWIPLEFFLEGDGAELLPPDSRRRVHIRLGRAQAKEFSVALTGRYYLPPGSSRARLELPRPVGVLDRGGKVTFVSEESLELLVPQRGADEPVADHHHHSTTVDQSPAFVDLAWRRYRPEFPASGVTDVTVHDTYARIRHQVTLAVPVRLGKEAPGGPAPLRFRVPEAISAFQIVVGGKLLGRDMGSEIAWVIPSDPEAKEPIVFEYDVPLSRLEVPSRMESPGPRSLKIPLIWPDGATQVESKVRVWTEPGMVPGLATSDPAAELWKERGMEVVARHNSLPALVAQSRGLSAFLPLRLSEPADAKLPGVVLDRALIQAFVEEDGTQIYRARYLVRKFSGKQLQVEFPAPVLRLIQNISLDHKSLPWHPADGDPAVAVIKVEPSLYSQPVVLDVEYKIPAGLLEGTRGWQTALHPPIFGNEVILGRMRWQVGLPPGWTGAAAGDDSSPDYHWAFRNGLLTPEPSATGGELESWLTGRPSVEAPSPISLLVWRNSSEPLRVWHMPRQAWFLVCSGAVLLLGLALAFAPFSRFFVWFLILLVVLGLAAVAGFYPALVPVLFYGAQPGALVLLLVLGAQWMLRERYRRQVVFMPGFTRMKSGSSLGRQGSINRPREPSTVDAPPSAGMSDAAAGAPSGT